MSFSGNKYKHEGWVLRFAYIGHLCLSFKNLDHIA